MPHEPQQVPGGAKETEAGAIVCRRGDIMVITGFPPDFLTEEGLASSRDDMLLEMERQTLNSSDCHGTYQLGANALSLPLNMLPRFVAWCREE